VTEKGEGDKKRDVAKSKSGKKNGIHDQKIVRDKLLGLSCCQVGDDK